jgi:KipI family sensor histidine kinase inhibitor
LSEKIIFAAEFRPSGDRCVLAVYGQTIDEAVNDKVHRMAALLRRRKPEGIEAVVGSYCTLAVHYHPLRMSFAEVADLLRNLEQELAATTASSPQTVDIPVCYGGDFGPDLGFVAAHCGLSEKEVIARHSSLGYRIYAIGFAPGFCYLGGLDQQLHTPRLESPRQKVAAGSVGIAGSQTGVYPLESPGGWRLIGRTPLRLFAPERAQPLLYQAGDIIRFRPITPREYAMLKEGETP